MFRVNDTVYLYSKDVFGVVVSTNSVMARYPLEVRFEHGVIGYFTVDGRISTLDKNPAIFKQKVEPVPVYSKVIELYGNVYTCGEGLTVPVLYDTPKEARNSAKSVGIVDVAVKFTSEPFYIREDQDV